MRSSGDAIFVPRVASMQPRPVKCIAEAVAAPHRFVLRRPPAASSPERASDDASDCNGGHSQDNKADPVRDCTVAEISLCVFARQAVPGSARQGYHTKTESPAGWHLKGVVMPQRIHIIGRKNSGKTTLIVELVQHLKALGFRVGTIKHTHHHHELDTPGKDSHRHRTAGAVAVGILARGMSAVYRPGSDSETKDDRYAAMLPVFADCDLILVEGDSQTDVLKVEVWRRNLQAEPIAAADPSVAAVVTDDRLSLDIPSLPRGDIPALADWLLANGNNRV